MSYSPNVPGTPGMMSTYSAPAQFNSSPSGGQAGTGSTGYGTLTNRWRNGIVDSGNQAGTAEKNQGDSRNSFLDILNTDPSKTLSAYVQGAMGDFNKSLQSQRESSIQRGIGTGDLGTAYEGSLDSAFQKNIAGQAASLYGTRLNAAQGLYGQDSQNSDNSQNRYLDALTGQRDAEQNAKNSHNSFLGGIIGSVTGAAGAALGGGHV
jgi:hypothetical protein